jgi:hypothetical protein
MYSEVKGVQPEDDMRRGQRLGFGFGVGDDPDAPVGLDIEGERARAQCTVPLRGWSGCSNLPGGLDSCSGQE